MTDEAKQRYVNDFSSFCGSAELQRYTLRLHSSGDGDLNANCDKAAPEDDACLNEIRGCDRIRFMMARRDGGSEAALARVLRKLDLQRDVCGAGFFFDEAQNECMPCEACNAGMGLYRTGCGFMDPGTCEVCADGTYATDGFACEDCVRGKLCKGTGTQEPCPAGFFCDDPISSEECDFEGQGHHCPEGSVEARECQPGFVCVDSGATPAEACEPGVFCEGKAHPAVPCTPGTYCPDPTVRGEKCSAGHASANPRDECTPCPAGKFQPLMGSATCQVRLAGGRTGGSCVV